MMAYRIVSGRTDPTHLGPRGRALSGPPPAP
jgi:hypothetical protein